MKLEADQWDMRHLHEHLQYAVDLEVWTIPYYMSALYSIKDRSSKAFDAIQSIVNQEMLHVQLAANVCNAFGLSPAITAPAYEGQSVPHLDFALDKPDPREKYHPFSAEIGPLDELRMNGMCLIEYPESDTGRPPELRDTVTEYGSIGDFYDAVAYGARLLQKHIHGGRLQVDLFSAFYRHTPKMTVECNGAAGYPEVRLLLDIIRDQGEGRRATEDIAAPFRNTADDTQPQASHFEKFVSIRDTLPPTYAPKALYELTERDLELQNILAANFAKLRGALQATFEGRQTDDFSPVMFAVGGNIVNCWKNGVTPRFG
jgi:Ferritin-like